MFSIVIPTYNRAHNLELTLAALEAQREAPTFEVIIADDGSTDNTRDLIINLSHKSSYELRYIYCGPNLGFRPNRTRNIGIAQAKFPYVVLIDSDIMLNPDALHEHARVREAFPDLVVVGLYHFAAQQAEEDLTPEKVRESFDNVLKLVPPVISKAPPVPGWDCRIDGYVDTLDPSNIITQYDGLGFFGGNQCWPVKLWWGLGGQDEMMPSGMGEDAEMGQRMTGRINGEQMRDPVPVLQYKPVFGVHYHHERNVNQSRKLVEQSIAYIDRKYGIGTFAKITDPETDPRDMSNSVWYTRKQDAMLVRIEDEPTVYAITGDKTHYVGLTSPSWFTILDFQPRDVVIIDRSFLDGMNYMGAIQK